MDQFAQGLAVGGVLTMIKQYPDTLQPLFVNEASALIMTPGILVS